MIEEKEMLVTDTETSDIIEKMKSYYVDYSLSVNEEDVIKFIYGLLNSDGTCVNRVVLGNTEKYNIIPKNNEFTLSLVNEKVKFFNKVTKKSKIKIKLYVDFFEGGHFYFGSKYEESFKTMWVYTSKKLKEQKNPKIVDLIKYGNR